MPGPGGGRQGSPGGGGMGGPGGRGGHRPPPPRGPMWGGSPYRRGCGGCMLPFFGITLIIMASLSSFLF